MKTKNPDFPFKCVLSLAPLVQFWDQLLSEGHSAKASFAKTIRMELEKAPELAEPIGDPSILEQHQELLDLLMSAVFPAASRDSDLSAAFVPFHMNSVYATPEFRRLLMRDGSELGIKFNVGSDQWAWGKIMRAYFLILSEFYDLDMDFSYPLIVTVQDPETGLDRHLSIKTDTRFVDIKKTGKVRRLSEKDRRELVSNPTDLEKWMDAVPPASFEFHGFGILRAIDVTDQEILSSLKRDLIEKESIFSEAGFERLQGKLRAFLRKPDLQLGLAALQGDQVLLLSSQHRLEKGCIFADSMHCQRADYEGSIFHRAIEKGEAVLIEDLRTHPDNTHLEEHIIESGIRSVYVTPLYCQDKLLGTFDLKSPDPGEFNPLNTIKLWEILPLFSMALNRGMEELGHRVQAIIKEKCTAIHPAVEWRFQQAALEYMPREEEGATELEPIVFRDVYPLYGATDIRGSSEYRNAAIQADLIRHLSMSKEILQLAADDRSLPILDALSYRIDKNIREIQKGLSSGDEVSRLDFIRYAVEPVFAHIEGFSPRVRQKIRAYRDALEPSMGTLYEKRKDFELAVALINETVVSYLDAEEETAQGFFPHYFEKMKTDGVDHTIYIGGSMVEDGKFDLLYLRNLRLWQLMVMCGVVWRTEELKASLRLPLETAHLVLVHNTPLSIRFRQDERRFDVDGAYDIRHEILKKRIDKAVIKGKAERLTQPGKIAIVYSHRREALEYHEYIDYLQATGYLNSRVEDLALEDLQGAQGLKALRVPVNMRAKKAAERVEPKRVENAVRAMTKTAA